MAAVLPGVGRFLSDDDVTGNPIDFEAEYNNRAAVPDHPAVMARWKADAETASVSD